MLKQLRALFARPSKPSTVCDAMTAAERRSNWIKTGRDEVRCLPSGSRVSAPNHTHTPSTLASGLGPLGQGEQGGGAGGTRGAIVDQQPADINAMHFRCMEMLREGFSIEAARAACYPAELLADPATHITEDQAIAIRATAAPARDRRILTAPLHPEEQALLDYYRRLEAEGIDTMAGQRIWKPGMSRPAIRPEQGLSQAQEAARARAADIYREEMRREVERHQREAQARAERDRRRMDGTMLEAIRQEREQKGGDS